LTKDKNHAILNVSNEREVVIMKELKHTTEVVKKGTYKNEVWEIFTETYDEEDICNIYFTYGIINRAFITSFNNAKSRETEIEDFIKSCDPIELIYEEKLADINDYKIIIKDTKETMMKYYKKIGKLKKHIRECEKDMKEISEMSIKEYFEENWKYK
jgi:hypothetical protein